MIGLIDGLEAGVFGIECAGTISADEIDDAMLAFERAVRSHYDQALLIELARGTKWTNAAFRDSFHNRLQLRGPVRRLAIVGEPEAAPWFNELRDFVQCEGRIFPPGARADALAWLTALPVPGRGSIA